MTNPLALKFHRHLKPQLASSLKLKNFHAVPQLQKITLNVSSGEFKSDKELLQKTRSWLSLITGQTPKLARARLSVANFNLRQGDIIGLQVTLRHNRMYDFFQKLVEIVLPQVKDFQGVSLESFDGHGNYNLGLAEQIIFPEVDYDKIGKISGLGISITTTAKNDPQAKALLESLGFPFAKPENIKSENIKSEELNPKSKKTKSKT